VRCKDSIFYQDNQI